MKDAYNAFYFKPGSDTQIVDLGVFDTFEQAHDACEKAELEMSGKTLGEWVRTASWQQQVTASGADFRIDFFTVQENAQ